MVSINGSQKTKGSLCQPRTIWYLYATLDWRISLHSYCLPLAYSQHHDFLSVLSVQPQHVRALQMVLICSSI